MSRFSKYLTASSSSADLHEKGSASPAILPKLTLLETRYDEVCSFFIDILSSAKGIFETSLIRYFFAYEL